MLDVVKLKEACRICARELCGNQRRWIFHPAAKLNLQVLLSAALGRELTRDGRGEFACSKCAFMLERMYRFDTVVARVEALSLERLHKLLLEKERLRLCIGGLYRRNNAQLGQEEGPSLEPPGTTYAAMLQDDLAYSPYEAWADREEVGPEHEHYCQGAADSTTQRPRRCRGCATLRVADSDYEAVCKVPRRVGQRSTSCGPSTRYSPGATPSEEAGGAKGIAASEEAGGASGTTMELPSADSPSPASSLESLDTALEVGEREEEPEEVAWGAPPSHSTLCGLDVALRLLRGCEYHPLQATPGSRLPLLLRATLQLQPSLVQQPPLTPPLGVQQAASCEGGASCQLCVPPMVPQVVTPCPEQELQAELAEMEEQWQDDYVQCGPFPSQQVDMG